MECNANAPAAKTITSKQILVPTYIMGRCRPTDGETVMIPLSEVIGAHGEAAELAEFFQKIPFKSNRQPKPNVARWIDDATTYQRKRNGYAIDRRDAIWRSDTEAQEKAEKALEVMKVDQNGAKITPLGIGFSSLCDAEGYPDGLILLDADIDLKPNSELPKEEYLRRFEDDPHVIATWDSRRGCGIHGLFVCATDGASIDAAIAYIKRQYRMADDMALSKRHEFIALPGAVYDARGAVVFEATPEQKKAYADQRAQMASEGESPVGETNDKQIAAYLKSYLEGLPNDCAGHLDHKTMLKKATHCGAVLNTCEAKDQGTILFCADIIHAATYNHENKRDVIRQIQWAIDEGKRVNLQPQRSKRTAIPSPSPANTNQEKPRDEKPEKPEKPKKKAIARGIAAQWYDGYTFDTFKRELRKPNGQTLTLDDAAAELCRSNGDISLNMATEAGIIWVCNNPERNFDSLQCRVRNLAAAYTPTDAGAIERYAMRCEYDEYERRRLRLWLYQVCARAEIPGEKTDGMLVLAGHAEGTKKSTFFDAIAVCMGEKGAAEFRFKQGADSDILMATTPIVVVDELDKYTSGKIDVAEIKTRITQRSSKVRAPYDRDAKERLNRAVFGATTNTEDPIPAGEGEARRYWVLHPQTSVQFGGRAEVESVMREAAHDTLTELKAHEADYDPLTTTGKIWVQSDDEERETAIRNGALKMDDAPTIAVQMAIRTIAREAPQIWGNVYNLTVFSAAVETGDGRYLGCERLTWTPPRTQARAVSRVLNARDKSRAKNQKVAGKQIKGCKIADIADEFCPGLQPGGYQTNQDDRYFD